MKSQNWIPLTASSARQPKSVLTPLLWLNGILLTAVVTSALRGSPALMTWFMVLATIVIIFTLGAYGYFAVTAPQRLQSEGHVEQMAGLSLIGSKGEVFPLQGVPSSNPSLSHDPAQSMQEANNVL